MYELQKIQVKVSHHYSCMGSNTTTPLLVQTKFYMQLAG